jgi:hypothetical protein
MNGRDASQVFSRLAERLRHPQSPRLIKLLESMVSLEEGRLLLELPSSTAELAKKSN